MTQTPDTEKARIKKFGEVWTPSWLVKEILLKFPKETWADKNKTVLDHSCGHGNFLIGALIMKIKKGRQHPLEALRTIYGVEIQEVNVLRCRERLLEAAEKLSCEKRTSEWVSIVEHNIILGDGLKPETWSFDPDNKES